MHAHRHRENQPEAHHNYYEKTLLGNGHTQLATFEQFYQQRKTAETAT